MSHMLAVRDPKTADKIYRILLLILAVFFLFEFVIHFFGLPVLEHDKIFLPTHDRYIGLFGLTIGGLLIMLATTYRRDKGLYRFTSWIILAAGVNAVYISATGAYAKEFAVNNIDAKLGFLGAGILVWYIALKVFESLSKIKRV